MAFPAQDGSMHTNMDSMKRANAKHMANTPAPAPQAQDQDVLQSPEVMQCFQKLAQAGVSPDEVMQAYSQVSGDAGSDQGGMQQ